MRNHHLPQKTSPHMLSARWSFMQGACANCPDCIRERAADPYLSDLFGSKRLREPVLYHAITAGGGDPPLQVFSSVVRHTDSCFSFLASRQ
jgi:hypothetical protein